ncbi:ATP-binding protein [Methylosinus sp. Sm6]|uniref:sensor histidine kinase n=1 Tax=Methylosinus sp. Sm6 TaxID=2866948 RepID=UPI001C98F96F|nr:ATP-binding protein [Methylosinus sp. Sm6]MBY6239937.1 PAS domain-containing protein [Methylosinus sp. Sm6]
MTDAQTAADDWRRLVFDETSAALMLIDRDGAVLCANAEAQRLFHYSDDNLRGRPITDLLPDFAPVSSLGGGVYGARRDGVRIPVFMRLTPLGRDAGAPLLAAVFRLAGGPEGTASLVERAAGLEEANERLARFAFVASQDLQEPLRKIATFGDLMQSAITRGVRDEIVNANEVMRLAALRARALVEDLLSFSRIVNDELELAALDLREAIEASLEALAPSLAAAEARIEVDLPSVSIAADAVKFQRLMRNILSNAVKYRKPGRPASIAIRAFRDARQLCLAIADEGIGFEAQYAQRIFEPLKQLHSKIDYPGSGVGLAMCKAIADRHNWRISVEAQPGVGATFFIVLPLIGAGLVDLAR